MLTASLILQGVPTLWVASIDGTTLCTFESCDNHAWSSSLAGHTPVTSLTHAIECFCTALSCGMKEVLIIAREDNIELADLPCGLVFRCDGERQKSSGYLSVDWVLSSLAILEPHGEKRRAGAPSTVSINHELIFAKTWHMKVALAQCPIEESQQSLEEVNSFHKAKEGSKCIIRPTAVSTLDRLRCLNLKQIELHKEAEKKWSPERSPPRVNKHKRELYVAKHSPPDARDVADR